MVDFSQVDQVPAGKLLLACTKLEITRSKAGNLMANGQFKVLDGEGGIYNGRMIFDSLMLQTNAVWRTKEFVGAFLGTDPGSSGEFQFDPSAFLGQQAWCLVTPEAGTGEYAGKDRARVTKYGIKPPV
jgi:hypothetical protein